MQQVAGWKETQKVCWYGRSNFPQLRALNQHRIRNFRFAPWRCANGLPPMAGLPADCSRAGGSLFPATGTLPPAFRRNASFTAHDGIPNHPRIPWLCHQRGVPWHTIQQNVACGHLCRRTELDRSSRHRRLLNHQRLTAMAGAANTGTAINWTGHPFGQANWHAFGRLAWNPKLMQVALVKTVYGAHLTTMIP